MIINRLNRAVGRGQATDLRESVRDKVQRA